MLLSKVNKTRKVLRRYKRQTRKANRRNRKQRGGTISCTNVLGQGAFGIVLNCKKDDHPIAVKFLIKVNQDKRAKMQYDIHENERAMYKYIYGSPEFNDISKEHLLKFVDLQKEDIKFADEFVKEYEVIKDNIIATELCNFDMHSLITGEVTDINMNISGQIYPFLNRTQSKNRTTTNEPIVLHDIAKQIFDGLTALYKMQIVHCDLKADNILITDSGNGKYIFKVSDFGFAAKHENFSLGNYDTRKHDAKYNRANFINMPVYRYNTFLRDLLAYIFVLYTLINFKYWPYNSELIDIEGFKKCGIFNNIVNILSTYTKNHFVKPYKTHNDDYEAYSELYVKINSELAAIFEDINSTNKLNSISTDKYKIAATSSAKYFIEEPNSQIYNISQHYSRGLSSATWLDMQENRR